ncbi:MAG TPA: 1-acyl-sn-glycerol-3-phosphate acyltransferase [Gemmatimonadaceae bacterium]|nr:1-acyl-sn-glycerol-3-phosphate acyltransferase [Gemmatimonadaceae bacterium]
MELVWIPVGLVVLGTAGWVLGRRYADRSAARALLRHRARVDRFKLASRAHVRAQLLSDPEIYAAILEHTAETGESQDVAAKRVRQYVDEIVPFFNVIAYFQVGYRVSRAVLNLFYKVTVEFQDRAALQRLPKDAVLVYLMNHRSNADYVLVGYALSGQVAISYAVGEWARAFPLEFMFKAFGAYFVRRRYRERLYHTVLERYVQLITRQGVTQGIFLEGGLTRDGRLRQPKLGLLDYVLGIAREPEYRERMYIVPVAVNYDRVLEDRSLLMELARSEGAPRPSRLSQMADVGRFIVWNVGRLVTRRWKRYGRAAVVIGTPVSLAPWFRSEPGLFSLPRAERLARVQGLCDGVMDNIGRLIPVTSVTLACAAIQSLESDFLPCERLLARMEEMRDALVELNGRGVRADVHIEETFDRAWRMLRMRRILARDGNGYVVIPRNRPLVSYYANSIAHLLGPFESAVRDRDTLPAARFSGEAILR